MAMGIEPTHAHSASAPAPRVRQVLPPAPALVQTLAPLAWPASRWSEGLQCLAARAGLKPCAPGSALTTSSVAPQREDVPAWLDWAADQLGIEIEAVDGSVPEVTHMLRHASPAVLPCTLYEPHLEGGFWLLLHCRWGQAHLLGPDLQVHRVPLALLRTALCWAHEAPLTPQIDELLQPLHLCPAQNDRVRQALLQERLAAVRYEPCWMLRQAPSARWRTQWTAARLPQCVAAMLLVFALVYLAEIVGWRLMGSSMLDGKLDTGWLHAWWLLMFSLVPLQTLGAWFNVRFAVDTSRLLKTRLMAGALRLDLQLVRRQGVGTLLGQVIESQALESLAVNGGLAVGVALLELVFALWVMAQGAAPWIHAMLLALWLLLTVGLTWHYGQRLRRWTEHRLLLTHELVENMVGHRTRLAQEQAARREPTEDQAMQDYLATSAAMDRASVPVLAGLPSGWLLLGLAGLVPAFVAGQSASALAISLGGILIAQRALGGISGGLSGLGRAATAWHQVRPLFQAGGRQPEVAAIPPQAPRRAAESQPPGSAPTPLVDARGLAYAYSASMPVLQGVDLRLHHGERVLLQGPSGGGKSTLAALLTGLRQTQSGLLMLQGLDRHTLGDSWHHLATAAPQFHENHVLSGTLAFNLLLGRNGPPSAADLREAQSLCEALGLGALLQRMPGGLSQRIGETGWQLSHGERSRLFLARALLQGAPLTVMDESFAALDPQTLARCLSCAMANTDTLLVIAHP